MNSTIRETDRHYFHSDGSWNSEPEGAVLRLDTAFRSRRIAEAHNRFFTADGRGGWRGVEERTDRSGRERGLIWSSWVTAAHGVRYLAFQGIRVVDQRLVEELFAQLQARDDFGEVIDPTTAGTVFLLDRDDAKVFSERVRNLGGEITRGQPLPAAANTAATSAEAARGQLEALLRLDLVTHQEAQMGNFSGLAAFEQRAEQIRHLLDSGQTALITCQRAVQGLLIPGRTIAEQAAATTTLKQTQQTVSEIEMLWETRQVLEREVARHMQAADGHQPVHSVAARRLLLTELTSLAHEAGYQTEPTITGVRIRIDGGWLQLDESLHFQAD